MVEKMPLKREYSAGGIVYKKVNPPAGGSKFPASAGSRKRRDKVDEVLWLVAQHSQHKGWVFPKGIIGDTKKDEKAHQTAVREVKEETGVEGKIITKLKKPVSYFYVWSGEKRLKTVYYFLMQYAKGSIKNHDHEMSAVEWLPTDEVMKKLTYKSDKEAFEEALKILRT